MMLMTMIMNNSDDSSEEECGEGALLDLPSIRFTFILLYCMVFLLCLFGNLFTLIVICLHTSMRTATNFFLANLAVVDLLVAIFCILQNMFHVVVTESAHWPLGELLCRLNIFVLHMVPCTSIGILVCVSFEKYIAVLHPLIAAEILTPNLRLKLTLFIWILSFAANLPYFFNTVHLHFETISACTRGEAKWLITASFIIWYCIPLTILAFIYTRIGLVLWDSAQHGLVAIGRHSDDSTTTTPLRMDNGGTFRRGGSEHGKHRDAVEARKKVVRLLIIVVLSFALFTLPNHARLLYMTWTARTHWCNNRIKALLQPLTYLSLFISSSVNPILYAFLSRRFRDAVKDILRCRKSVSSRYPRSRTVVSEMEESPSLARYKMTRL